MKDARSLWRTSGPGLPASRALDPAVPRVGRIPLLGKEVHARDLFLGTGGPEAWPGCAPDQRFSEGRPHSSQAHPVPDEVVCGFCD